MKKILLSVVALLPLAAHAGIITMQLTEQIAPPKVDCGVIPMQYMTLYTKRIANTVPA